MPMRTSDGSAVNGRLADRSDDRQSGAHGPFGIALASLRPTEIDQRAIAHIARNKAAEARYGGSHTRLVATDHGAQVLRVQLRGKRGGVHHVAEHHADLPTLGSGLSGIVGCSEALDVGRLVACAQQGDSIHQPATMTDCRDAQFLQIIRGEIGQDCRSDLVLPERRLVPFEAQRAQPVCYVHRRFPRGQFGFPRSIAQLD